MGKIDAHPYGHTLALYAARRGYNNYLKWLVEAGADLETKDSDGGLPCTLNLSLMAWHW